MAKSISAFLILGLTLLINFKVFSQVAEDTSSRIFNDGGYVRGVTAARAFGLVELGLGLSSLIIAGRAKRRSSKRGAGISLTLGFTAIVSSAIHFFVVSGAVFGSGSGKAGSIIAFLLGVVGAFIALPAYRSINR